jgi:hypothetical protein
MACPAVCLAVCFDLFSTVWKSRGSFFHAMEKVFHAMETFFHAMEKVGRFFHAMEKFFHAVEVPDFFTKGRQE